MIVPTPRPNRLYVGTHRRAQKADQADRAFGIYAFECVADKFEPIGITETEQPGWVAAHPNGRFLYAVNEVRTLDGRAGGGVTGFAIDRASGVLTALNRQPTPPMPCHCAVDASGRFLLVATFGGGSIHLFALEQDGRIGAECDAHVHSGASIHPLRQTEPHAHAVAIDPGNRFVLVPDLGTDTVMVYELDRAHARIVPHLDRTARLPPGSGPRHIAFGRNGCFLYLMNEMNATVAVFAYEAATGALRPIQTVDLLPKGFVGLRSGAAIAVHPQADFLYATTRSHGSSGMPREPGLDSLVWFVIHPTDGTLRRAGARPSGGQIPRSFAFDPDGAHLLVGHQRSGTLVSFQIDLESGEPGGEAIAIETPVPVCLVFA